MQTSAQIKILKCSALFHVGGGSSLGYKMAGFNVIGNVEIDPKVNAIYQKNCRPKYNYCEDLRAFNARDDLPAELYEIDILDGSPPCTSFSMAGVRERDWGKQKKFREGQTNQTLDDLFFTYLDTVEKLRPKIAIAENVPGIVGGKARGYVHEIVRGFKALGYELQIFLLNSATMGVPQQRRRVFFIANRINKKNLELDFFEKPIKFGEVRTERGKEINKATTAFDLMQNAQKGDKTLEDVATRLGGKRGSMFTSAIVADEDITPTITASGDFYRLHDKTKFSEEDYRRCQSFPADYDFIGQGVKYVCGMSVPPVMMARIAKEVYKQWLS